MRNKRRRKRKSYPSDVSDDEWQFVLPYLTLMRLDAPQRDHGSPLGRMRAVFDALRWLVRSGSEWRMMPHDLPPWAAVYQQSQRWLASGAFAAIVHGGPFGQHARDPPAGGGASGGADGDNPRLAHAAIRA